MNNNFKIISGNNKNSHHSGVLPHRFVTFRIRVVGQITNIECRCWWFLRQGEIKEETHKKVDQKLVETCLVAHPSLQGKQPVSPDLFISLFFLFQIHICHMCQHGHGPDFESILPDLKITKPNHTSPQSDSSFNYFIACKTPQRSEFNLKLFLICCIAVKLHQDLELNHFLLKKDAS